MININFILDFLKPICYLLSEFQDKSAPLLCLCTTLLFHVSKIFYFFLFPEHTEL